MVERLYIKSLLNFKQVELEFDPGLVVFSGPSGAGKSVLMGSILAGFGLTDGLAELSEMELHRPEGIESDLYELDETTVIKLVKRNTVRCYINGQSIPRKGLREMFAPHVRYLSVRDKGGFESQTLVRLIDDALISRGSKHAKLVDEYNQHYRKYREDQAKLEKILSAEKELAERIEFARYEIDKIRSVDPREGEIEELMTVKRQLSRIEKIEDAAKRVEMIFEAEGAAEELYALLEKDGSYLSDALNQLRTDMEEGNQLMEELSEMDVESILDRLEQLNSLIKRYGSIADALKYLADKEEELAGYTHIEEDKNELEVSMALEGKWLDDAARRISAARQKYATKLSDKMGGYLSSLKLPHVDFVFEPKEPDESGADKIDLKLAGSVTATLSGGEHNRLRLALMASALGDARSAHGVVILDEIDANVSGDESIAIAKMIAELSRSYQVFAISHQPHLAAQAVQHILVAKEGEVSRATQLDRDGRIREIARIIGGEEADDEAVAFAKKIVEN